jgi:hypothetical protein
LPNELGNYDKVKVGTEQCSVPTLFAIP